MKRYLKIKAFTLLVAWFTILVHSVIPHNHIYENITGCHELMHDSGSTDNDCSRSSLIGEQPSDNKVCHVSSLLFTNFNHDNIFVNIKQEFIFSPELLYDRFISITGQSYISDHFHGTTSFRAPPLA